MVSGAMIAGIGATEGLLPHAFDDWFGLSGNWALLVGGFALIITLLVNPEGIAGTDCKKKQRKKKRLAAEAAATPTTRQPDPDRPAGVCQRAERGEASQGPSSSLPRNLRLLRRPAGARRRRPRRSAEGQLVGLIGPNGAGKTTFIDAISGFVPYRGQVELDGRGLDGLAAHGRAGRGLARTWQSLELFDDLSVRENLAVASYRPSAWSTTKEVLSTAGHEHGPPTRPSSSSAWSRRRTRCRTSFPRASASWSGSRVLSRRSPGFSASTSPRRGWTRARARSSDGGCGQSSTRARRCSSSITTWGSCSASPTTSSCSSSGR